MQHWMENDDDELVEEDLEDYEPSPSFKTEINDPVEYGEGEYKRIDSLPPSE